MPCSAQRVTAGRSGLDVDGAREPREPAIHWEGRAPSESKVCVQGMYRCRSRHTATRCGSKNTIDDASRPPNPAGRNEALSDTVVARRGRGGAAPGQNEPDLAVRIEADDGEGSAVRARQCAAASEGWALRTRHEGAQARARYGPTEVEVASCERVQLKSGGDRGASDSKRRRRERGGDTVRLRLRPRRARGSS